MRDFVPFACLGFTLGSLLLLYLCKGQWLRKFFLITLTIVAIVEGLFILNAHAAIDAGTVWEVRTTGDQLWSGGFVNLLPNTSTDYSQADNCQTSWKAAAASCTGTNLTNDLASTNASGGLTLTSAAGGFTDAMVGNVIHITAGTNFTAGWYQITAYASANSVTITPKCNTGTNDASAGTGYVGGAFKIGGTLDSDFFQLAAKSAGNTVYIQGLASGAGSYTVGESIDASTMDGTATLPTSIIGYITNRTTVPTGTDRPILAFGNSYTLASGDYNIYKNIIFTKTGGSGAVITCGAWDKFNNIKVSDTTATANQYAINPSTNLIIDSSEITVPNGYGIYKSSWTGGIVKDCYIHDNVDGIHVTTFNNGVILNNIFDTNSSNAIYTSGATSEALISQNTFYNGSKTGTAITGGTGYLLVITNNIFEGFNVPITFTSAQPMNHYDYNAYFDNTSASNSNVTEGSHSVDLIASAFASGTPHASTDFRVGTGVKALGSPGSWVPMGLSADCVGYPDIGAVQRIEPVGGGTGGAYSF